MPPRRSLEVDKRSSAPYLFLGLAEIMIRDYEGSEEHLLKAFEIGEPAVAHIYLANLYEQLGEPTKSIEQLQAFLRENPGRPTRHKSGKHRETEKTKRKKLNSWQLSVASKRLKRSS